MHRKAFDNRPVQKSNQYLNLQNKQVDGGSSEEKARVKAAMHVDMKGKALAAKAVMQHEKNVPETCDGIHHKITY